MNEFIDYYENNPDDAMDGCLNTGQPGDGVVFRNVEPINSEFCFIGRQSVLEAFAILNDMTPNRAKKLLKTVEQNKELLAEVEELREKVAAWEKFARSAEDAGVVLQLME